jgi:hypothetical protein
VLLTVRRTGLKGEADEPVVLWMTGPPSRQAGMAALGFARSRIAQHKDGPPDGADRLWQQGGGEKCRLDYLEGTGIPGREEA